MQNLEILIKHLNEQVRIKRDTNCYSDAIFFAEKLVNIMDENGNWQEEKYTAIYELAQCYYLNQEYLRVVQLICKHDLSLYNYKFQILLGQAFVLIYIYICIYIYIYSMQQRTSKNA